MSNTQATFEVQFIKKLSNTEGELKKSVAYRKSVYIISSVWFYFLLQSTKEEKKNRLAKLIDLKAFKKIFWKTIGFVKNQEITQMAGGGGSYSLRHYDSTKIDM